MNTEHISLLTLSLAVVAKFTALVVFAASQSAYRVENEERKLENKRKLISYVLYTIKHPGV